MERCYTAWRHGQWNSESSARRKRFTLIATVIAFAVALALPFSCGEAFAADVQEKVADDPHIAVVNFQPEWGNVEANVDAMEQDIAQADASGVDLILFPEMSVTGYVATDDLDSPEAQLAVGSAEAVDGPVATRMSHLAQQFDMWVFYGNTEKIAGDSEHAYNSVFACAPDGTVSTYQKIHPVEGAWCESGSTPMVLNTEWGKIGVNVCYDTYAVPELERYYAWQGCRIVLNPTATSRGFSAETGDSTLWQWCYSSRLNNIAIRDGIYVASANLTGFDGSHYTFPGGSCIVGPTGNGGTAPFQQFYAGSPANQKPGMYDATLDLSTATATDILSSDNFKPALYSSWYKDLSNDTDADRSPAPEKGSAVVSTVNFQQKFGDKEANFQSMKSYVDQASQAGANILVFPEMALTGYAWTDTPGAANGQTVVDLAESVDGPYAKQIASLAQQNGMYIVFGTSEKIDGDDAHAYNSAFVCSPDGTVQSYRKIAPVEGPWCTAGSEPLIIDTPYGSIGISICKDTYAYPELSRYYMAKGCTYLINPTARTGVASGWQDLYTNALENLADQDKMIVVSADLCGADLDAPAEQASWDPYSGASGIAAPLRQGENGSYVRTWGSFASDPSSVDMVTASIDYADLWLGNGHAVSGFAPALYADMYAGETYQNTMATIPAVEKPGASEHPGGGDPEATEKPALDQKDANGSEVVENTNGGDTTGQGSAGEGSNEPNSGARTSKLAATGDSLVPVTVGLTSLGALSLASLAAARVRRRDKGVDRAA